MKYTPVSIHSMEYALRTSYMPAPAVFIRTNPSIPHVEGIIAPNHRHTSGIAYRGHVIPDINKNMREVNTNSRNDVSLSRTKTDKVMPKKTDDKRNGTQNAYISH